MKKSRKDQTYFIEDEKPEFNMMAYYNMRMDRRSDERDLALNDGDLLAFYRTTMTLLMNSIPRFKQKKMPEQDILDIKGDLLEIGKKIKNMGMMAEQVRDKNALKYHEELFEYNIKLNIKMFEFGLVYPLKEIKPLADIIEEDF